LYKIYRVLCNKKMIISILYINKITKFIDSFGLIFFVISIITLNKFLYNNVILLMFFKNIRIFIIFVILLSSLKKIDMVCYI